MSETLNKKTAIILFNLGGPDSLENVRPFLFNLFSDKWIIRFPLLVRKAIAYIISKNRYKLAQENYQLMGGKSPLLAETQKQKKALEESLRRAKFQDFEIFISMRYWNPLAKEVVKQVKEYNPDEIIFLPLYPQFSSSTTLSSFEEFESLLKKTSVNADVKKICCYYDNEKFIDAHISLIKETIKKFKKDEKVKILFSAHSIPVKYVKSGDPYEWQIINTVKAILKDEIISKYETSLCYQSKVGPIKWLSPTTESEIEKAAKEKFNIIIIPIAFISEHIETLVELDIEYKHIADSHNVRYERVEALGINKEFISSLTDMVLHSSKKEENIYNFGSEICPENFSNCVCRGNKNGSIL